jgi:hypothetical protein
MAKCRNCEKEFSPIPEEASKTFLAQRVGFCSERCDKSWGHRYDRNVTVPGAFGKHWNGEEYLNG